MDSAIFKVEKQNCLSRDPDHAQNGIKKCHEGRFDLHAVVYTGFDAKNVRKMQYDGVFARGTAGGVSLHQPR